MPIIRIYALPQKKDLEIPRLLTRLCLTTASILGCPPRTVWATWETLKAGYYVEADSEASMQPHDTHPPIVEVLLQEGRSPEMQEKMLVSIASELCHGLDIEEGNAFITVREIKKGQVYTGGSVSRSK